MSKDLRLASCDARVEMIEHHLFNCNYVGAAWFGSSIGNCIMLILLTYKWVKNFESKGIA